MIFRIRLLQSRRQYELMVPRDDDTDFMSSCDFYLKREAFCAARSFMEPGDVLFYCPDLPCHEMYWCRGTSTRKRLVPSTSSNFDISMCELEYREYVSQSVLSVVEATVLYGRCWDVYRELGYTRPQVNDTADPSLALALSRLTAQVARTNPMMFGISRAPVTIDGDVSFARNLYRCNYEPNERYCVLTPRGFELVRPTVMNVTMMKVGNDVYLPCRFLVYQRAIDIYCSGEIEAQDKLPLFLRSLRDQIDCMSFLGFDCVPTGQANVPTGQVNARQPAVTSPTVPYVVRPNMNTRMVTL